jgi:hypothetical protein
MSRTSNRTPQPYKGWVSVVRALSVPAENSKGRELRDGGARSTRTTSRGSCVPHGPQDGRSGGPEWLEGWGYRALFRTGRATTLGLIRRIFFVTVET